MNIPRPLFRVLATFVLASPSLCHAAEDVFWEAEETGETNMATPGSYRPINGEEEAKLSGGAWMNGSVAEDAELFAEYTVKVAEAGDYRFFARKFWQHGALRWQVDGGDWTDTRKLDILDSVVLREYVPLTWVLLGEFKLAAGEHKIRLEVSSDPSYEFSKAYGFDCFLLTTGDLVEFLKAHPGLGAEAK